jgi:apolipoprotein N-acyltransferase
MSRINMPRVILGGIVAGIVINVSEAILNLVVLGAEMEAAMARLNLPPISGQAIAVFVVMGFVVGILTTWLYAAIRPRFGPGPTTALCAGATVWFFAYFYSGLGMVVMGMFTTRLMTIAVAWGLVEILAAAVAGAALYKE